MGGTRIFSNFEDAEKEKGGNIHATFVARSALTRFAFLSDVSQSLRFNSSHYGSYLCILVITFG